MSTSKFEQSKLTRHEWNLIEDRIEMREAELIEFIEKGYSDVNLSVAACPTILSLTKLKQSACVEAHIYRLYLEEPLSRALRGFPEDLNLPSLDDQSSASGGLKTRDRIRIENTTSLVKSNKDKIIELVLIGILKKAVKKLRKDDDGWMNSLYTLVHLLDGNCKYCNPYLSDRLSIICSVFQKNIDINVLLRNGSELIEGNDILYRCSDLRLYHHQKELFDLFRKSKQAKLVLYVAPTGTGKTLSPLGLLTDYRIVFVCAARHVGLAIAKAAINRDRGVGFAFGCEDESDIKLHYGAAVAFDRDIRSGGIKRVDNTKGAKVELMVTDLKSYPAAMRYMMKFNLKENLIMYWDEPTISLDYKHHNCHDLVRKVWLHNLIPNIVMASATLPPEDSLLPTKLSFSKRFEGATYSIASHDCKKSITVIDRNGDIVMPHSYRCDLKSAKNIAAGMFENPTHRRYLDINTLCRFVVDASKFLNLSLPYKTLDEITTVSLKKYYLEVILGLSEETWSALRSEGLLERVNQYKSSIYLSTTDAHTLTGGPTIYLAHDVGKIGDFLIQTSSIPGAVITQLEKTMSHNNRIAERHRSLSMKLDDLQSRDVAANRVNKLSDSSRDSEEIKSIKSKMAVIEKSFQKLELPSQFVPNSIAHLQCQRHGCEIIRQGDKSKPFCASINPTDVSEILAQDGINPNRKLLLLMGIGIFDEEQSSAYSILMKKLASDKKLFLVVASSDYIYGTNYQFSHGYLGKDIAEITRSKIIQAMGRVGRNTSQQQFTFRFRSNEHLDIFLGKDGNPVEANNFARLLA